MTIEISRANLCRSGRPILSDLSVCIPCGGITALIGPNGAGKSSLLHAAAGLLPLTAGGITVDGAAIAAMRPCERARRIAVLTQAQTVTLRLTVRDLLAFGRWPHHRGRPTAEDRRHEAESAAAFDLGPVLGRPLDSLSGGQRQRAFVAMAHAQTTPWMLLDEPLAALDPRYSRDIMARLHALSRPGPDARSIVVVLHDIDAAARWADHVVALRDGRLFAAGPRREVLTPGILSGLFDTPFGIAHASGRDVVYPC